GTSSLSISVSAPLRSGGLRRVDRWHEPRLGHQRPRYVLRSAVQPLERERPSRDGDESAGKLRPAVQGLTHPAPHIFAYRPRVFALFLQLACQAGRRELEIVRRLDESRHVPHIPSLAAHRLTVANTPT